MRTEIGNIYKDSQDRLYLAVAAGRVVTYRNGRLCERKGLAKLSRFDASCSWLCLVWGCDEGLLNTISERYFAPEPKGRSLESRVSDRRAVPSPAQAYPVRQAGKGMAG